MSWKRPALSGIEPARTTTPTALNQAGARAFNHRASVANGARREDQGELVPACGCGAELDRDPVCHSVRCGQEQIQEADKSAVAEPGRNV